MEGERAVKQKAQHLEDHLGEQPTHTVPLSPSISLPRCDPPPKDSHGQELHPKPIQPRPTPRARQQHFTCRRSSLSTSVFSALQEKVEN